MQISRLRLITSCAITFAMLIFSFSPMRAQTAKELIEAQNELMGYGQTEDEEGLDGEGEGRPPGDRRDSTDVRVKRPLESYFFSDSVRAQANFIWNVNPDYNSVKIKDIDTTLNDWRIDYIYYKDGVGDMTLGGLGQATQPISYYERANFTDFSFAQPFESYIFTVDNTPFYNVKRPFTHFSYLEAGQKSYREANFELVHAQNINPSTSFALDYKSRSTKGQYQRQETKNHNLALTFSHTGKRYSVHAAYLNNSIDTEENGGVVGLWAIRDSIFEQTNVIPTKLGTASAENKYRNNTIFVEQSYGIPLQKMDDYDFSMADKTAVYVGHSLEYTSWNKVYSDIYATYTNALAGVDEDGNYYSETGVYYDNWYIDPTQTRDSLQERVISNRFFLQAQPWGRNAVVATLDGGIGIDFYAYSQFGMDSYLTGELERDTRTSWFAYGKATGKFKRYLDWQGEVQIHPAGYRAGDMMIGGDVALKAYIRNKPIVLSGKFKTERRSPSYWQENLFSNHYVFDNDLQKEDETRFEIKFEIPSMQFELGAKQLLISNLIYYNDESLVSQESDLISFTELYLRKNIRLGGLNLDHRVLAQWSTDEYVAPVPELSLYLSYYYEFSVVKNVLRMQLGVDGRYTSKYYMPTYNPALSTFVNQHESEIGGYPYLDAYASAKWKRMRILVKYQHLNMNLLGNDEYFSVAGYPMNPSMLKIGFSWGFYD